MLYLFKAPLEEILTKCGRATVTTVHEVVLVCVDKTEKSLIQLKDTLQRIFFWPVNYGCFLESFYSRRVLNCRKMILRLCF